MNSGTYFVTCFSCLLPLFTNLDRAQSTEVVATFLKKLFQKRVVIVNSQHWNRKELWDSRSTKSLLLLALTLHNIGESLFTFFASLAYVPLFFLELQNRLF